jgi:hypothetical protein
MKSKTITRLFAFFGMIIFCTSFVFTVAQNKNHKSVMSTNEDFPKVHNLFLFKKENLGNVVSFDTYHMNLKEGKEYYFYTKIKIESGIFGLAVTGPGGADGDSKSWDSSTPASERKISLLFTPTADGEHVITVSCGIATDGGSYFVYGNRNGFAGWWWMLLSGIGILLVIVVLPIVLIVSRRKKKRKKRKRRRR